MAVDVDPTTVTAGSDTHDLTLLSGQRSPDLQTGVTGPGDIVGTLWVDLDADGLVDANEPRLSGVDLTLTDPGPDGVLGNGDDVTAIVTTDADGGYIFPDLLASGYRVTLDPSTLPAGVVESFETDGTLDGVGLPFVTIGAETRFDIGFRGTSALEHRLWVDFDQDAVADSWEPGIPRIPVTVQWAGADGIFGNADDWATSIVTDTGGRLSLTGLPAGDYRIVVTAATMPNGLTQSVDPDGIIDQRAAATLTPDNTSRTLMGYEGTASLGDVVWIDADRDGNIDSNEDRVPGVEVLVVWAGFDGVFGTADDVTLTTTTRADGTYLIDGLPSGDYEVRVIASSLPRGTTATTVRVTLIAGQINLNGDIPLFRVASGGGSSSGFTSPLAFTGASTAALAGSGLALVAVGWVLMRLRRRRGTET